MHSLDILLLDTLDGYEAHRWAAESGAEPLSANFFD
jgi:hypothetical protein